MISLVDRIFHIQIGGTRHRGRFAVLDGHRAIALLGPDLQRYAVLAHPPRTNETIIHGEENRFDDLGNPQIKSGFDDDARLVFGLRHRLVRQCLLRKGCIDRLTKKSESRSGPTLHQTIKNMTCIYALRSGFARAGNPESRAGFLVTPLYTSNATRIPVWK